MNILYLALMSTFVGLSGQVEQDDFPSLVRQSAVQIDMTANRTQTTVQILKHQQPCFAPIQPTGQNCHVNTIQKLVKRSALGFIYDTPTGLVTYVDARCDLLGRIYPGDYILAFDNMSANTYVHRHLNFGPEGTIVQCTFSTNQGVITLPCIRHDCQYFSPAWQAVQTY